MNPFAALRLPPSPGLDDEQVRAAWRAIAAATHPDRADGGDPARFAAAASAYSELRTRFGRNETMAGITAPPRRSPRGRIPAWASRVRDGRPRRLALRVLAAAAFCALVVVIAGWRPATPALMVGAVTWLIRTGRHDLAGPLLPEIRDAGPEA